MYIYKYWEYLIIIFERVFLEPNLIFASYIARKCERLSEERMSLKLRKSVTESILAIVCNILRAHTVTRGCVLQMESSRGKFCPFSFPRPPSNRARWSSSSGRRRARIFTCTMHSSSARKLLARLLEKGVEGSRSTRSDNKWCFICRAMPGGYRHVDGRKRRGRIVTRRSVNLLFRSRRVRQITSRPHCLAANTSIEEGKALNFKLFIVRIWGVCGRVIIECIFGMPTSWNQFFFSTKLWWESLYIFNLQH